MTRLTIVGDAFLDLDWVGSVSRVAPDAPVPLLDAAHERRRPGGAGLAALAAARHGAAVVLVTALGDDNEGALVHQNLAEAGVTVVDLGLGGTTPVKLRLRAGGATLARVDWHCGDRTPIGQWTSTASTAVREAEAVLVSDGGRGMAGLPVLSALLQEVGAERPVVWDPHMGGPLPPEGVVDLFTPNLREAAELVGEWTGERDGIVAATQLAEPTSRLVGSPVAITAGGRGAVLVEPDRAPVALPCSPVAGDACGAGDRFAATLAVARARHASREDAVRQAVAAARQHILAAETAESRSARASSALVLGAGAGAGDEAAAMAHAIRQQGGVVVVAGGCFDVFHAGHLRLLETARQLGDCLIVCVDGDLSVRRLKGRGRPVNPLADRVAVLAGIGCVDAVAVVEENAPGETLRELQPHIFVKGADHADDDIPERAVLSEWAGEVVLLPLLEGRSTTRILCAG